MGLKRVMWVRRYQGQCRALPPLGHQGYRLRSYNKDQPLCSGYSIVDSVETTPEIGAREEPRRSGAWRTPEVEARREVRRSGRKGLDMEEVGR